MTLTYVPADDILFVGNLANKAFNSEGEIDRAFDEIQTFWRTRCAGRKVYCIVEYTNVSIDPRLQPHYAKRQKEAIDTYSITTVRWGADLLTRTVLRALSIKSHRPSNLYATKDDAIQIVRGIRGGGIKVDSSHSLEPG